MTILGRKPQNHPQQVAVRVLNGHPSVFGDTLPGGPDDLVDDRRTPRALWDDLNARYRFTLDAAASDENALCPWYFTRAISGLTNPWGSHRVWCNPPYSDLRPWVLKAWEEMRENCVLVVMLLPANRCEQGFWQDLVEPMRDRDADGTGIKLTVRFLRGRPRFGRPEGAAVPVKGDRPPFGLCTLTWTHWGEA